MFKSLSFKQSKNLIVSLILIAFLSVGTTNRISAQRILLRLQCKRLRMIDAQMVEGPL